ncbi:MAG: hypothetical protein KDM64_03550 [Verrucomicrobiae bacterium]|nr:hypothetical protein [Verrucomicrobiae bacterium]
MPEAATFYFVAFFLGAALFLGFRSAWPESPEKRRLSILCAAGFSAIAFFVALHIVLATARHPGAEFNDPRFVVREFVPGLLLAGMAVLLLWKEKTAYGKK